MYTKRFQARPAAISSLVIIFAFVLCTTVIEASPKCNSSDFACFKRKMMRQVGRRITVEGRLASAKLGWIVTFDHWGIYVYARHESDSERMKNLDTFKSQQVRVTGTLRYSQGSPSQTPQAASVPEHFFFDIAEVKVIGPRAPAEITFREMRLRKPPLAELYFDITLHNYQSRPLWFLLPSNLGSGISALLTKGGVDTVEVFAPRGSGRVIVGHFLGTGGFYALLLPARAEVRMQVFPISYWGDPPDQLQVGVVTAQGLRIGGEPAASWFELNPTSSARAAIAESVLSPARMIGSRHSPDRKEVKAMSVGEKRFKLEVSLKTNK
ncbi:MAG: hypothetical protein QOG23_1273 [Blastocatellia bacterium]|jgi:hypothetical protein|nr:hypothetical protein [Blastocatellia bacterium]